MKHTVHDEMGSMIGKGFALRSCFARAYSVGKRKITEMTICDRCEG